MAVPGSLRVPRGEEEARLGAGRSCLQALALSCLSPLSSSSSTGFETWVIIPVLPISQSCFQDSGEAMYWKFLQNHSYYMPYKHKGLLLILLMDHRFHGTEKTAELKECSTLGACQHSLHSKLHWLFLSRSLQSEMGEVFMLKACMGIKWNVSEGPRVVLGICLAPFPEPPRLKPTSSESLSDDPKEERKGSSYLLLFLSF